MEVAPRWKEGSGRTRLASLPLSTRLLSALAILVYLAAALSPCEEPLRLRVATEQLHAVALSPQGPLGRSDPRANAVRDERAHDHSGHDHTEGEEQNRHQPAPTHSVAHSSGGHDASHHRSEGEEGRRSPAFEQPHPTPPTDSSGAQLAFTAPCVCGCGDARATVGGGATRLGAVVPGQFVAELLSIRVESALRPDPGRFVFQVFEIDPIPI